MQVDLHLWGTPELRAGGTVTRFGPERRFQLLAWLALQRGQWRSRDDAAALLWPEHVQETGRRNLRKVLHDARRVPGTGALASDGNALRWPVATDVAAFDAALRALPPRTMDALAMRRGPLLDGLDAPGNGTWSEWLSGERSRLHAQWQRAAHHQLGALAQAGHAAQRDELARRLLDADPFDDVAMAAWIELRLAAGEQALVLQGWRAWCGRLAKELGIEPPSRLRALVDAASPGAAAPRPAAVFITPSTASAPGDFVGRAFELATLRRLLSQPQGGVVTVTGPGGIGKSCLVAQALALADPSEAEVLSVPMHDLDDIAALVARLAQRLGVALNDRVDSAQQLGAALASRRRCLALDNAEHLADLPPWLERLRAAAPALQLLITSRHRLQLAGEHVLALQGLALPDEDSRDIEAAPAFDAVRLFAARATRAQPGFALRAHLAAVIDIVQHCNGMPLAIELAAAWVRLLPPSEIARDLAGSLDLLERDPSLPTQPARPEHASVRAVFERSLQLLSPHERDAIQALAVFRGSFTRAAAQAVAGVALPLLASLVDKSLLGATEGGRFALHPLLAALARERLQADAGRHAVLMDRHAGHLLGRLGDGGVDAPTAEVDALIDTDEPDLRQAWEHALARRLGDLVAAALPVWAGFFERRARMRDGAALLRPALQWPAGDAAADRVQGRARAAVARLWFMAREPLAPVRDLAESGLAAAKLAGDEVAQIGCLSTRAACDSELGQVDAARDGFERALALAQAHDHGAMAVRCLRNLGSVATRSGDYPRALALQRQARQRAREAGLGIAEADALMAQAGTSMGQGDWLQAESALREGLHLVRSLGAHQIEANGRCMLGCTLIELGQLDEARQVLLGLRDEGVTRGDGTMTVYAETYLALADLRCGLLDEAEAALRKVARQCRAAARHTSHLEAMRALLFYGELLARRGDAPGAANIWLAVQADTTIPSGERDAARRWRLALPAAGSDGDGTEGADSAGTAHETDVSADARARLIAGALARLTGPAAG